jgi:hypothetical protein
MIGAGVYGGWCTHALRNGDPQAPLHVHGWFGLTSLLSLGLAAASGTYGGACEAIRTRRAD